MLQPLAKRVLIPLELTAAASGADAGTQKSFLGSGTITLIRSNLQKWRTFIPSAETIYSSPRGKNIT